MKIRERLEIFHGQEGGVIQLGGGQKISILKGLGVYVWEGGGCPIRGDGATQ